MLTIYSHPAITPAGKLLPNVGLILVLAFQLPLNNTCPVGTVSLPQKKLVPSVRKILPLFPVMLGQYFNREPFLKVIPALISVASLKSMPWLSKCTDLSGTILPMAVVQNSILDPRPVSLCVSVAVISMRTLLVGCSPSPSAIALPPKRTMMSPASAGCGSSTVFLA